MFILGGSVTINILPGAQYKEHSKIGKHEGKYIINASDITVKSSFLKIDICCYKSYIHVMSFKAKRGWF